MKNRLPFFLFLLFSLSCSQSIKIYENDQLVSEIHSFSTTDTTINIRDYFITYKLNKPYIEGFVENTFDNNKGTFKSTGTVEIEIGEGKFKIEH